MAYKMTKIAIVCPSTEEIHAWLDAGNDPNGLHQRYGLLLKSVIQNHMLRCTARNGLLDARLLLERGADPNKMLPARSGLPDGRLLRERGAAPNKMLFAIPTTVFQYACSRAPATYVALLLEFGAEIKSECLFDTMDNNSDERAAEILDILISAGANIEAVRFSGNGEECWDPLPFACVRGMDACVRVLLRADADPNRPLWDGSTCLHMAADKENPTIIEMLLDAGAQIDAQDKKGNTPLLYACKWHEEGDSEDTIRTLLAGGASLIVRNNKGKQARDYASTREMIELLTRQPKGAL